MKWFMLALLISANVLAQVEIKELPVAKVYVPRGFDSNDAAQVIVSGTLPNLCYKSPRHSLKKIGNRFIIKVEGSFVNNLNPDKCLEVPVPFLEEVTLGELAAGNYKIALNGESSLIDQDLVITEAKVQMRDDNLYADVKFIEESDASRIIKLEGYHPNDCMVIDRVEVLSNDKDTLSLMPISKMVPGKCNQKRTPFEFNFEIPHMDHMARGVLLHVRVMDGRSVNHLFQNKWVESIPELVTH